MKKNRKAFTLVEILAVVVIIGVVFTVATIGVTRYIGKGKKDVFKRHQDSFKTASKNMSTKYLSDNNFNCNQADGKCPLPKASTTSIVSLRNLEDSGFIESLQNPFYKESQDERYRFCDKDLSIVAINNKSTKLGEYDLEHKVCLVCGNKYSPGCNDLYNGLGECLKKHDREYCKKLLKNDLFTDQNCEIGPGCVAVSCSVESDNAVWTNKDVLVTVRCNEEEGRKCLHEYVTQKYKADPFTYKKMDQLRVYDTGGDFSYCTVGVYQDTIPPLVRVSRPNKRWSGEKDNVTIEDKADFESGISTWGMGVTAKPDYNLKEEFKAPNGISSVYAYAKDKAGNEALTAVETLVDNEPPVIADVLYGYPVFPRKDDISSNAGSSIAFTHRIGRFRRAKMLRFQLRGASGTLYIRAGGKSYTRTVGRGQSELIVRFSGPTSLANLSISGSSSLISSINNLQVFTDETGSSGIYTNQSVTLYIDAYDSLSGIASYLFDGNGTSSPFKTFYNNSYHITVGARDKAGNEAKPRTVNISNIDKSKPSCSARKSNVNTPDGVTVVFSVGDSHSGLDKEMYYSFLGESFSESPWGEGAGGGSIRREKVKTGGASSVTGHMSVMDRAGNKNSCSVTVYKVNQHKEIPYPATPHRHVETYSYTCPC